MDKDIQGLDDLKTLIRDARESIQDAYSISCIIDHLRCQKVSPYEKNTCYTYIKDRAEEIMERLNKYGFNFEPKDPFDKS